MPWSTCAIIVMFLILLLIICGSYTLIFFFENFKKLNKYNYLEKNLQLFTETQNKFKEYSKKTTDSNPFVSSEAWPSMLSSQAPNMQKFMSNYIEQTKNAFSLFEKQIEKNFESKQNYDVSDNKTTKDNKKKK